MKMGCCSSRNARSTLRFTRKYERVGQGEILGRGSYGVVCEYLNKRDGVHYAVKKIVVNNIPDKTPEELAIEGAICADLDHVNIARYFECYFEMGVLLLVFELVIGKDIFTEISSKTHYSERDASSYIRQLLGAIEYCHEHDIVHADIKPNNILLRPCDDTIKLIDFGHAFEAKDGKRGMYSGRGALLYLAPEMASDKPYGKPIDLWSCGVILYNILSGVHPFTPSKEDGDHTQLKTKRFKFPSPYFDGTSQHARNLISGLMRRDQDTRETASLALKYPLVNEVGLSSNDHRQLAVDGLTDFFSMSRYESLDLDSSGESVNPDEQMSENDLGGSSQ